jgi:hypothetical protein
MDTPDEISPRHVFETRIQIRLQRDNRKLNLQGWARNLSESGLGAFVAETLLPGELVTLEIPMSEFGKQVVPGKVTRVLGTECGFQFIALSAEQRQQIRASLQGKPSLSRFGAEQQGQHAAEEPGL